jgi:hypothetical protein
MSADERALTQLRVAFTRHGITKRADVLRLASEAVGRYLWSTKAMTPDEVADLVARLARVPVGNLPGHAARLEREEAARAAAAPRSAIVCTRGAGEPTDADRATIERFAARLEVLQAAGLDPRDPPDEVTAAAIAALAGAGLLPGSNAPDVPNAGNVPDGANADNGGVLPLPL